MLKIDHFFSLFLEGNSDSDDPPRGCLRDCSWAPSLARSISITSWQKTVEASLSVLSARTASDLMSTESISM